MHGGEHPDRDWTPTPPNPRTLRISRFDQRGGASCARIPAGNRNLDGMALVTRTFKTDDLDNSEDGVSTVHFALDKINYEIDLSAANNTRLREKLARFLDAATEVKDKPVARRGRKTTPAAAGTRPDKEQTQAIREWARANGYQVSDRGRIAASIQEAFSAAH